METIKFIIKVFGWLSDLGLPPAVSDEVALRAWLAKLAAILQEAAALTPVPGDDAAAKLLALAVSNDEMWTLLYGLLVGDGNKLTGDESAKLGEATAIDPAIIIAIVNAILELIKMWRDRKKA